MLKAVLPKLAMRNKTKNCDYYCKSLGFKMIGKTNDPDYLMLCKDGIEIHFFLFEDLNPTDNYGMVYIRTDEIDTLYKGFSDTGVAIHPNGKLEEKPWGQIEFSLLDPDLNLLTFGQNTA